MTDSTAVAVVVSPEERAERDREGASLTAYAGTLVIDTGETFRDAAKWLQEIAVPLKRKIAETFRPRIEQAYALHKGLLADEKRFLSPVEDAERVVRSKLAIYEQAEAQRRREAEAAAQREQERLEREAREEAASVRRALQAAAETRRIDEAAALEALGDRDGAERLIAAPLVVPVVLSAPVFMPYPAVAAPPRVEGVSFRDDWTFEVEAPFLVPREYLQVNDGAIRAVVKALKGATAIPGVRVFVRRVSAVRAG